MTLSTAINSSFNNHTVNGNLANHNGAHGQQLEYNQHTCGCDQDR